MGNNKKEKTAEIINEMEKQKKKEKKKKEG